MTYTCRITLAVSAPERDECTKLNEINAPVNDNRSSLLLPELADLFDDGTEHMIDLVADTPTSPVLSFHSGIVRSPPKQQGQHTTVPQAVTSECSDSVAVNCEDVTARVYFFIPTTRASTRTAPTVTSATLQQQQQQPAIEATNGGNAGKKGATTQQQQQPKMVPQYVLLRGCGWGASDDNLCGALQPQWHPFTTPVVLPLNVPVF